MSGPGGVRSSCDPNPGVPAPTGPLLPIGVGGTQSLGSIGPMRSQSGNRIDDGALLGRFSNATGDCRTGVPGLTVGKLIQINARTKCSGTALVGNI